MEAFDITKDVFLVALDQPLFRFYSDRLHFSIIGLFTVIEQNLSIRNGVTSFTLAIFQPQPVDLPRLPMRMRLHSLLGTALTITLFALIKVVKRSGVISLHICEDFSPDKLHLLSSVLFHPYLIHSRKEQEAVTVNVHNTLSNIILTRKPELVQNMQKTYNL